MKISCQSCQSKYNVADEKVQGKIVKIRCRKCGATIVVDGTAPAASNGAAPSADEPLARVAQAPAETGIWHVNVAENDQRSMRLTELAEAYRAGVVTQETYIWTDGMADWIPIGEVAAVWSALNESVAPPSPGRATETPETGAYPGPSAATGLLVASVDPDDATRAISIPSRARPHDGAVSLGSGEAFRAEPKRAALKRETGGRDLFASGIHPDAHSSRDGGQPFSAAGSPIVDQAAASLGNANDASGKLTGERNENSVLFSLAVLTKNVDERAIASDAVSSNTQDSGLIDLKALAAKTESMRPSSATADGAVFSAPLGGLSALGSPLGDPLGDAHPKSRLPWLIGTGAGALLILAIGIVIGVKVLGGPSAGAGTAISAVPVEVTPATATVEPVGAAAPSSSTEAVAAAAASAAAAGSVAASTKTRAPLGAGWHPSATSAGVTVKPAVSAAPAAAPPTAAPSPPPAAKKGDCGCNGDLMCLMKCSTH